MSHTCWLSDEHDEADAWNVEDSWSAEDAALAACDKWYADGTISEPLPPLFTVHVRDDGNGQLYEVAVSPDWTVTFHAGAAKSVPA